MTSNFEIKKQFIDKFGEFEGIKQFLQFEKSVAKFIQSKCATTPPEILATREETCRACDQWDSAALNNTGRCRKCGCSTWAKLRMATEACPLGKWEAVTPAPEVLTGGAGIARQ